MGMIPSLATKPEILRFRLEVETKGSFCIKHVSSSPSYEPNVPTMTKLGLDMTQCHDVVRKKPISLEKKWLVVACG